METENHGSDPELDRILHAYSHNKKNGPAGECPPVEEWIDYIDGDLPEPSEDRLCRHLSFCGSCQEIVLYFREETEDSPDQPPAWRDFEKTLPDDLRMKPKNWWQRWIERLLKPHDARARLGWSVAVVGLVFAVSLIPLMRWYPTELSRLAYVDDAIGRVPEQRALTEAAEDPIQTNFQNGLRALLKSQSWILNRVDESQVNEAIRDLEKAKALAREAHSEPYFAKCAFYLGKAHLKRKDVAQARREFEEVTRIGGSNRMVLEWRQKARAMLDALDRTANPLR